MAPEIKPRVISMEAVPEGAQLGGLGQLCPPPGGAAGGKLKPWSPPEPVPAP